jgi:hypothetical protein
VEVPVVFPTIAVNRVKILASNHANIHVSHRTNVPKYANIHVSTKHLVVDHANILVSNIIDVNKQFFAIFSFSWFFLRRKNVFIEPPSDYRTPTGLIILLLANAKCFTEFRQRGKAQQTRQLWAYEILDKVSNGIV